ncbi:MAG: glycoside hydrolase family 26 protein [Alkaliphilus sp.]
MMRNSFKRGIIIPLVMLLLGAYCVVPANHVYASEIPRAFWALNAEYQSAVEVGDSKEIIRLGWETIELFKDNQESQTALEIIAPRLEAIAKHYELLGEYRKAVETYEKYLPFAIKQGWDDAIKHAKAKISALTFDIDVYTRTPGEGNVFFNEKHEPRAGILFGATYDNDSRIRTYRWEHIKEYFPKKNSAYLMYLEWGDGIEHLDKFFQDAIENDIAVLLAWNTYCNDVKANVERYREYILETARYLKSTNIPIFLRYAGEMNLKARGDNPDDFKEAFRYVANIMREEAPNVAMVWSPNDIPEAGRGYIEYYPGDNYVDWVGISSYTDKYFLGRDDWGAQQENLDAVYFTGDYANPLAKIKLFMDFLEEENINKPMMVSEGGIEHYAKLLGRDLTDWASVQLRRLYAYGPMIYPRMKGMFYFNSDINQKHGYALYQNQAMNDLYNELVSSDIFLSEVEEHAGFHYELVSNKSFDSKEIELFVYTIPPKVLRPIVKYKINDELYATKTVIPYSINMDFSDLSEGLNKLTIEVYDKNRFLLAKHYKVIVKDSGIRITETDEDFSLELPTAETEPAATEAEPAATETEPTMPIGTKIGVVLETDIKTYINGNPINSFNINGKTAVVVEELGNYGFDVRWDGVARNLIVSRDKNKEFSLIFTNNEEDFIIGRRAFNVLYTDIKTYIDGVRIESFNINGLTAIYISSLKKYGELSWDNSTRTVKLYYSD